VEHNNFPVINQQRFGSQFVGIVGNPSELLLFGKKKQENLRAVETEKGKKNVSALKTIQEGEEDAIMKINIEDLVNETLATGNKSLGVLMETEMAQALEDFVVKKQATAISDMVQETLSRMQKDLANDKEAQGKSGISDAAAKIRKKMEDSIQAEEKQKHGKGDLRNGLKTMDSDDDGDKFAEEEEEEHRGGKEKDEAPVKAASQRGKKSGVDAPAKRVQKASPKKGRKVSSKVAQKGKKSNFDSDDDKHDDENEENDIDYDDVRKDNGRDKTDLNTKKKVRNEKGMIDLCDSDDGNNQGSSSRAGNSNDPVRKSSRSTAQQKNSYKENEDKEGISEDGIDSGSDYDNGNLKDDDDDMMDMDDEDDGGGHRGSKWGAGNGGRKAASVPAAKDKNPYSNARGKSSDSNANESVNFKEDAWDQSEGKRVSNINSYFSAAPPTATSARGDQSRDQSQASQIPAGTTQIFDLLGVSM
jgi:hypothetical protein